MSLSSTMLAEQLSTLGINKGDTLMTHVSLRRLGPLEHGPDSLLEALTIALGSQGNLLMVLGAPEDCHFDAQKTPVCIEDMGYFAEFFRQSEQTIVSDHIVARYAALGPQARQLIEHTPLHHYHGPGSVLERLVTVGGKVLRLGADIDTVTLTHYAEYLAQLPRKKLVKVPYYDRQGAEIVVESLDDCNGIVQWEKGDYFSQILIDYLGEGKVSTAEVGQLTGELLEAGDFVKYAQDWMEVRLS